MGNLNSKLSKLNTEEIKDLVVKERTKNPGKIPPNINKLFNVDELIESKCSCYRMRPKDNFNGTYIVYLYGSYTCMTMSTEQWDFITKLSVSTGCGLFIPMYPLAPEGDCKAVFKMLPKAYRDFCMSHDVNRVILMGDSTGAGLALSIALLAWKEGYRKPDQLILLSPVMDTEFFDRDMETRLVLASLHEDKYWFNESLKEFFNTYWVKDYAVKTEYTSPYYEDYTDLCDDVVVFSGTRDLYNCYARAFYQKAKQQGVNVRFYEFEDECHNFMFESQSYERQRAVGYLKDVINNSYTESLPDLYPVKLLAEWSDKYSECISDSWAINFIHDNKFDFSKLDIKVSKTRNNMLAANCSAFDASIRKYILEYPNCTIVNLGCGLENMFERMDNGRIQWYNVDSHNIMSVRRTMYGERDREKTVGRTIMDFTWLEDIKCNRNQGVLFVCKEVLGYLRLSQLLAIIEAINEKFPGAELMFNASTTGRRILDNIGYKKKNYYKRKKKLAVNDAQEMFNSWRSDIQIIHEEPVMKYFNVKKGMDLASKLARKYNLLTYNYKIIHMKIGAEEYDIQV